MTTIPPYCTNCKFWDPTGVGDTNDPPLLGLCRLSPPSAVVFGRQVAVSGGWPTTRAKDWCGEFQSDSS